jgi:hypothetical protein
MIFLHTNYHQLYIYSKNKNLGKNKKIIYSRMPLKIKLKINKIIWDPIQRLNL